MHVLYFIGGPYDLSKLMRPHPRPDGSRLLMRELEFDSPPRDFKAPPAPAHVLRHEYRVQPLPADAYPVADGAPVFLAVYVGRAA